MRILFTAKGDHWDAAMDPRFGRMQYMVLYDEETDELLSIPNSETDATGHHVGPEMASKVVDLHPDVIITGIGPGGRADHILSHTDITIYVGAGDMSIKEAYDAYKAGHLELL